MAEHSPETFERIATRLAAIETKLTALDVKLTTYYTVAESLADIEDLAVREILMNQAGDQATLQSMLCLLFVAEELMELQSCETYQGLSDRAKTNQDSLRADRLERLQALRALSQGLTE